MGDNIGCYIGEYDTRGSVDEKVELKVRKLPLELRIRTSFKFKG